MNPYTLIVTGPLGSVVVPLGTEAAKGWRTRFALQLENPIVAELRSSDQDSWPSLRVDFPPGSSLAFTILTQGILSTVTGVKVERKTYRLGWSLNGYTTYLCACEDGGIRMEYREQEQCPQP